MSDEHGMPVPIYAHGPFKMIPNEGLSYQEMYLIVDGENNVICPISEPDVGEFFAHAANNIVECRDLVRRLAEKYARAVAYGTIVTPEMSDASKLWTKMQREAKGDE